MRTLRRYGPASAGADALAGVLVADKPAGWTSHDVVARVKSRLKARKVGHLGTLDPLATGVLPLVVNRATRFADRLSGGRKVYEAVMVLGVETDTYDSEGRVVERRGIDSLERAAVDAAFEGLRGRILQVPPMYSAIKKDGVPLYKLARRGRVVEREAREVEVFSLDITAFEPPCVSIRVVCTRGTYVRSLCHDAGRSLGCGAHLAGLRRTGSGPFTLSQAVGPEAPIEALKGALIPLDEALALAGAVDGG